MTGIIAVDALAPNIFQILPKLGFKISKNGKRSINNSRARLVKNGILKYDVNGFLCLTEKGKDKLREIEAVEYKIISPRKWDNKWRVLIFDIKESRKSLRDKLRKTLISVGFVRLQDSVWVFPHDCEDLITLLKADFKIGKDVLYMVVDKIENDGVLRKSFGLFQ